MREMLNACYRQKCIWYDYRESRWLYDLDRLFEQFKSDHGHDVLDNDFITRRLNELPPASRRILAWAALLGSSFSFHLVCELMSGEFGHADDESTDMRDAVRRKVFSKQDAVAGLQAAVNACIIVQGETDDRFRFAHDRYVQAAAVRYHDVTKSLTQTCTLTQHMKAIVANNLEISGSGGVQHPRHAFHHSANPHDEVQFRDKGER